MNPSAIGTVQRPSLALLGAEPFRAALEFARHHWVKADPSKTGDGHPVVIFPGLGADGSSVATLRDHCRALGYEAFDWGQGFNTGPQGDLDTWLAALKAKVADLLSNHEQAATLIGWSLGGLYARELGKLMAPRVRQVITIGTPFNAEADHTNAGWLFRLLSGSSANLDPALSQRLRTPPPLRTTSIYSRTDGVVAWQTCRHQKGSKPVQEIEVNGSHIGMGWNREVLDAVKDRLGQAPGPWRRYVQAVCSLGRARRSCNHDHQHHHLQANESQPMPRTPALKSHRPQHDVPAEPEQPELPVEPDEGLIPPLIPEDPEHDRLVDPAAGEFDPGATPARWLPE